MLLTPWLVWSQYGGACSLSSVQGDIALIKLFSVASTPDFIAAEVSFFQGSVQDCPTQEARCVMMHNATVADFQRALDLKYKLRNGMVFD